MANLRRLALEMQHADDLDAAQQRWTERLEALHTLGVRLVEHGAALVVACDVVVTISRSAAVRSLVEGVASRGWCGRVVVLDGTVSGRGRDQAAALYEAGLDVRSLPDGAMLEAFDEPASSGLIVVGADAVSSRRFVNAQGTRLLLEVGEALGVRRVVVADSGKDVREADLNAVLTGSRRHWEQGPGRQWPVFEAIPRRLVDHRVSEGGCVSW